MRRKKTLADFDSAFDAIVGLIVIGTVLFVIVGIIYRSL